jgi:hypothetical protein
MEEYLFLSVQLHVHNEELHNSYHSPSMNRIIKSRRMKWAENVAHMGQRGFWWESQKEGDVGGRVILK